MYNRKLPSFFETKTIGKPQGLSHSSMIFSESIQSSLPCKKSFLNWGGTKIGGWLPVSLACSTNFVARQTIRRALGAADLSNAAPLQLSMRLRVMAPQRMQTIIAVGHSSVTNMYIWCGATAKYHTSRARLITMPAFPMKSMPSKV